MTSFFQPQTLRSIQDFTKRIVEAWDSMTPEQRRRTRLEQEIATGMINIGGVMAKLRPSAIEKRKQELAAMPPKEAAGAAPNSGVDSANSGVETPAQETIHNGTRIYPTKTKVGDEVKSMWAVESPDNQRRRAAGERTIGGDSLHDTLEQAQAAAEREAKRDAAQQAAKAEQDAADKARLDAEEARKAANRPKTVVERRKDAILDGPSKIGQGTKRAVITSAVDNGYAIEAKMVYDSAAKKRDQEAVDRASRAGYILGVSNENLPLVKAGNEAKARLKEGKYEKPEYRVYDSAKTDGGFYEITKTEFDYAKSLEKADKAARQAAPNDMNEADANIQNGNATRELSSFMKNERDAATRSEKVAEWRKQYSGDHAETIAAGDISRSDYEKLADLVRRGGVTEQRAVEMIESSVSAGVLDRFVADNMKKKVAAQQGTPTHQDPGEKPEAAPEAASQQVADDFLPEGWAKSVNGYTKRPVYRMEQGGSGADMTDDGDECGHDGAQFTGMEIDGRKFLSNGRRWTDDSR